MSKKISIYLILFFVLILFTNCIDEKNIVEIKFVNRPAITKNKISEPVINGTIINFDKIAVRKVLLYIATSYTGISNITKELYDFDEINKAPDKPYHNLISSQYCLSVLLDTQKKDESGEIISEIDIIYNYTGMSIKKNTLRKMIVTNKDGNSIAYLIIEADINENSMSYEQLNRIIETNLVNVLKIRENDKDRNIKTHKVLGYNSDHKFKQKELKVGYPDTYKIVYNRRAQNRDKIPGLSYLGAAIIIDPLFKEKILYGVLSESEDNCLYGIVYDAVFENAFEEKFNQIKTKYNIDS